MTCHQITLSAGSLRICFAQMRKSPGFIVRLLTCAVLVSQGMNHAFGQEKVAATVKPTAAISSAANNTLTKAERAAGWKLLFDGKTTTGWRGVRREDFPTGGWVVQDGILKHLASAIGSKESQAGGDIVTIDQHANFELQLEWRIAPGANSGVKYFVQSTQDKAQGSAIGMEMQILDDERHPDAKKGVGGNRTAGSLYDLIAAQSKAARPVGQFNHARLLVNGNHVEHWLNNVKVVEYELGSEEMKKLIAASKYKDIPNFGNFRRGHILLQDHGDEVWFRNIKIRELAAVSK